MINLSFFVLPLLPALILLDPFFKLSPWPDLILRDKGTHLGIVLGREVTLNDIWEGP